MTFEFNLYSIASPVVNGLFSLYLNNLIRMSSQNEDISPENSEDILPESSEDGFKPLLLIFIV